MLYWISWFQPTEDVRSLSFPPNNNVLGWWNTGMRMVDGASTICALVKAGSKTQAEEAIQIDWPEAIEWRFCDLVDSTELNDRFILSDWMEKRIAFYNKSN